MSDDDAVKLINHYCEMRKNRGINPSGRLVTWLDGKQCTSDGKETKDSSSLGWVCESEYPSRYTFK